MALITLQGTADVPGLGGEWEDRLTAAFGEALVGWWSSSLASLPLAPSLGSKILQWLPRVGAVPLTSVTDLSKMDRALDTDTSNTGRPYAQTVAGNAQYYRCSGSVITDKSSFTTVTVIRREADNSPNTFCGCGDGTQFSLGSGSLADGYPARVYLGTERINIGPWATGGDPTSVITELHGGMIRGETNTNTPVEQAVSTTPTITTDWALGYKNSGKMVGRYYDHLLINGPVYADADKIGLLRAFAIAMRGV